MKHKQKKKIKKIRPKNKTGMAPGMFMFIGEQKVESTTIELIDFDKDGIEEHSFENIDKALA